MYFCNRFRKKSKMRVYVSRLAGMLRKATHACAKRTGLPLVYAGVIMLATFYFTGLTNNNYLTLFPLAIMLAGTTGFVYNEKRKDFY